jgi:hypothetical protein
MFQWIKRNWFVATIVGLITYTLHILVEYLIVDSVLKFVGVSISIL